MPARRLTRKLFEGLYRSANRYIERLGARLGGEYHASPTRERLKITDAIREYIDAGLLYSDGQLATQDSLKDDTALKKIKVLNLLPDPIIRLMAINKTSIHRHTYMPFPAFGLWDSSNNRMMFFELADQFLESVGARLLPLLPVRERLKKVYRACQRYGFHGSDIVFAHEAGHMLHLYDLAENKRRPFLEAVEDTPFSAFGEATKRLAQFCDDAGTAQLQKDFEERYPRNPTSWETIKELAQTFRFALDIDSNYIQKSYPKFVKDSLYLKNIGVSYNEIKDNEAALRMRQLQEVVATTFAIKHTLLRDNPEILEFIVPGLAHYVDKLESRATQILSVKLAEPAVNTDCGDKHVKQLKAEQCGSSLNL